MSLGGTNVIILYRPDILKEISPIYRSIDAQELRKAMKALGFKISKESIEEMIGEVVLLYYSLQQKLTGKRTLF